jgi:DNA-binding CsgD family transcriptional regulator
METLILVINSIALVVGGAVVLAVYHLARSSEAPFLQSYLYFLICTVLAGFFDWIVFNLISVVMPDLHAQVDSIYHIFWDLIGFPCALLAVSFLFTTIFGMMQRVFLRWQRIVLAGIVLLLIALSILRAIFGVLGIQTGLGSFMWYLFLFGVPLFQSVILLFAMFFPREKQGSRGPFVRRFALMIAVGYAVWYILSYIPTPLHPSYHISILWYYAALVPPTWYMNHYITTVFNKEYSGEFSGELLSMVSHQYQLTEREQELLPLLIQGKSNNEVAEAMFVSLQTAKNYVSKMYKKTGVRNRIELMNLVRNTRQE